MRIDTLRKIRLLLEDFPKSHNLLLVAQPPLIRTSEGFLRRVRNLCVSALLETVRDR